MVHRDGAPPVQLATGALVAGGVLGVALLAAFVAIVMAGKDPTTYVLFVSGPAVTAVVGAVLGQRVRTVEQVARTVESQTNGQLSGRFDTVHEHLDEQTNDLLAAVSLKPASTPKPAAGPAPVRPLATALPEQRAPGERTQERVGIEPVS